MIKKIYLSLSLLLLSSLLLFPSTAAADPIVLDGVIGTTISFEAGLENPLGSGAPLFLNGSNFTIQSPLVLNDLLFVNFPVSVDEGETAFGTLFTVDLPLGMTPGIYTATYQILGGFTPLADDTLADLEFRINAQPASSPIPEPGTWLLLGTGLGMLAMVIYSRRRQASFGSAV